MRLPFTNCVICFSALVCVAVAAPAQETGGSEIQELRTCVLEMKRQMEEIEKRHGQEIQALKQQIERLKERGPTAEEQEPEDEAAFLRELAESVAGGKSNRSRSPRKRSSSTVGLVCRS